MVNIRRVFGNREEHILPKFWLFSESVDSDR
jgi:hypothetical protein